MYVLPPLNYIGMELWQVCEVLFKTSVPDLHILNTFDMSSAIYWIYISLGLTC